MPRKARELSPLEVRRLTKSGRRCEGSVYGLALQMPSSGAGSRLLRLSLDRKQREMGLGRSPGVMLADVLV